MRATRRRDTANGTTLQLLPTFVTALLSAAAAVCCLPLLAPPAFSRTARAALEPGLQKHLAVLEELVPAVQRGVAGYQAKYCDGGESTNEKRLILHEAHRRTRNKLNHAVPTMLPGDGT